MPLQAHRNIFAGNPLDRAAERRREPQWLADKLASAQTGVVVLWNGAPLVTERHGTKLLSRVAAPLAAELARGEEHLVFLGLDIDSSAVFALDLEGAADPAEGVLSGLGAFQGLRELAAVLPAGEAGVAATARALFEWRRRHRFCSSCGQATRVTEAGWKRLCPACGVEHFPRTDPVVIMLPVRGEQCLLGRQAAWPPGRYSALAGFMEPGEAIEEACAREIFEESGLRTHSVRYHSSQPWPFPTNLMIGLIAEVEDGEARADQTELEAVIWLSREETRSALRGESEIGLPPPLAIAHHLISHWAEEG